jgi:hypothetical protein
MTTTSETESGLKFSIRANWAPLYINNKLFAGRIVPLHRIDQRTYGMVDGRGEAALHEFFYSRYGIHGSHEDRRLAGFEFLKKHRFVSHAIIITYDTTILVLGYNIFHYRFTKTNPRSGIHVDYFTSLPLNFPDNIKPSYLGRYEKDDTFFRVRGVGRATMAQACCYAIDMHPEEKPNSIAVDLTARSDDRLIQELYLKKYGFEFYKGKRGRHNEMYFSFQKAKKFLAGYEKDYKRLERPEGNGRTYKDPFKY